MSIRQTILCLAAFMISFPCFLPCVGQEQEEPSINEVVSAFPGSGLVNPDQRFFSGIKVDRKDLRYRDGDLLEVEFGAEQDAYLYLLYHQADGISRLLFPNKSRTRNYVKKDRVITLPDETHEFQIRTTPPYGDEFLQAVSSPTSLPELDQLLAASSVTPIIPSSVITALEKRNRKTRSWSEHHLKIYTYPGDRPETTADPRRVGIFIGVGRYENPEGLDPFSCMSNSAKIMSDLMGDLGQLSEGCNKLLLDEQATKQKIEDHLIRWLPEVTVPGDTIFIYYSGHCGQWPNENEPDGQDEYLCAYDSTGGDSTDNEERHRQIRKTSIFDDTLASWLQPLQGRQIIVILDTCYSAGMIAEKSLHELFDNEAGRVKDISQLNTIVLTCSRPDERALLEDPPNDTMWFTHYLAEEIRKGEKIDVKQAFYRARHVLIQELRKYGSERIQEPVIADRTLLPVYFIP